MAVSPKLLNAGAQNAVEVAPDQAAFNVAASRYLEMVQTETGYAVVEPGAVERAMMLGSSRPGTLGGEFRRSVAQYKSFQARQ